jgi:anaerobic selenocysteine-containing dehydrogenase
MTAPGVSRRLEEIRERGGKVIVIDPRANETVKFADRHLFIRPGTDVYLLLSLLNVVFEKRINRSAAVVKNPEAIAQIVEGFTPERVAPVTGIDATEIRQLAEEFLEAESAVCYGRIGLSTQEFGAVCQWLINVLNIVTGNFDREGGAMFTLPAFDPITAPESLAPRGSFGRWRSRVRNLPEFAGELPVAALAEEIQTEGPGQIKALVTLAGNPVLSTPNGRQLDRALDGLEFMVSIDPYINETTSHANIILPPASILERGHYDLALHLLAVRNTAKFSSPMFERSGDTRHDWEILLELQTRIEGNGVGKRIKRSVVRGFLGPERMLDLGLRFGPHGAKFNPFSNGLTLGRLKKAVHGIDLGPLKPCLPERLRTSDKKIDLAPEVFVKDIERVKLKFDSASSLNGHLLLIGRRQLRSNNSWLHNSHRLVRSNSTKPDCTLLINPSDASERQLKNGEQVRVESRVGCIVLPVEVSDEMMRGVVSIPHGWGHDRNGNRLEVAQQVAGASINDLTDNLAIDAVCGTAAFNGTPVKVESAAQSMRFAQSAD